MHRYTLEQVRFIEKYYKGCGNLELTQAFNKYFELQLSLNQIKAFKSNHCLNSGLNGRFSLGHAPFNKGLKGVGGWEPTQFKKGNRPRNYQPVGSERVNGDGYVDIKTADPNKWKGKHILVWESANGPVPKRHAIIFGDRNRMNFELENLILVSRKQLLGLNKLNLIQCDAELTRTGVMIANIYIKIGERKKGK